VTSGAYVHSVPVEDAERTQRSALIGPKVCTVKIINE
jgi:hypothetical protein